MLPEVANFSNELRRRNPRSSTARHYTEDLKLFFAWAEKPSRSITLRDIDRYIEHCQRRGHASATINRRLASIRSFYTFLDFESTDPLPNPVIPSRHMIPIGRRLPRDAEDAEIEELFRVVSSVRDRAMYLLMLRCGLRVSEVHNLSLGDVYRQPTPGSLPRLWVRGKNGSQRVVYLSAQTLSALEAWLAVRPRAEDQAVFVSRFEARLKINSIQVLLGRYCRKTGVWVTCHQLRHAFARHLVEAQVPIASLQKLLGHAGIRTTQTYLHISDTQVQRDYEAAMQEVCRRIFLEEVGR